MMMHEAQEVGKVATDQEMWVLSPMGECLTFISSFPKILSGLCQFKKNLLSNYDIQVYGFISIYQTLLAAVHYGWNQESQVYQIYCYKNIVSMLSIDLWPIFPY